MDNYTIKIAKGLANNADARLIRQQVFFEEQGFVNVHKSGELHVRTKYLL